MINIKNSIAIYDNVTHATAREQQQLWNVFSGYKPIPTCLSQYIPMRLKHPNTEDNYKLMQKQYSPQVINTGKLSFVSVYDNLHSLTRNSTHSISRKHCKIMQNTTSQQ